MDRISTHRCRGMRACDSPHTLIAHSYQDEFLLLKDLAPLTTSSALKSSYSTLLNPLIVLFSTTVTSLIAFIKRSLHKYAFLALASYEHLLSMQSRWDEVLALRGNRSEGNVKEVNEFREGLTALRSICLRSFPEFLADIKLASMGSKGYADVSTGLVDFTIQVSISACCSRMLLLISYIDCQVPRAASRGAERCWCCTDSSRRWKLEDG